VSSSFSFVECNLNNFPNGFARTTNSKWVRREDFLVPAIGPRHPFGCWPAQKRASKPPAVWIKTELVYRLAGKRDDDAAGDLIDLSQTNIAGLQPC
jgi:hypothetical protein